MTNTNHSLPGTSNYSQAKSSSWILMVIVALYTLLSASYFVVRYGGQWADSDTANMTEATLEVLNRGTLQPADKGYRAGYAYQSIAVYLITATGLTAQQLQYWIFPLLASGLSVLAFVMYRELIGNAATAAIATMLLFIQPDFLFVIFRGSHEKITWLAVIMAVYVLARSFAATYNISRFVSFAGLFYLFVLLLVGSNAYMGSAFIIAINVSLVAGFFILWALRRKSPDSVNLSIPRLVYITGLALMIWFLIIFYVYPSAADMLRILDSVAGKSIAIGLGVETGQNPYAALQTGWVSRPAYLGLALPTFWIGGFSFLIWLSMGVRMLRGKIPFQRSQQLLLWLIYAGFGVQLGISLIVDRLGSISGNFQLRIFPPLLLFAVPLVAMAIEKFAKTGWVNSPWRNPGRDRISGRPWFAGVLIGVISLLLFWASLVSLMKATNDPWLGNYWIFWTSREKSGLQWADKYLRNDQFWVDQQGIRLSSYASSIQFGQSSGNINTAGTTNSLINSFLISDVIRDLSTRLPSYVIPDARGANHIYDNGSVSIYRKRSLTPFQR
jgi:hypothetical protein